MEHTHADDTWNAEHYGRHAIGRCERGCEAVGALDDLSGVEEVLDIGCDDGRTFCVDTSRDKITRRYGARICLAHR